MSHLRSCDFSWIDQTHKRRIQEALDRVIRYVEDLDATRERAQIVKDELANALADKMNKNMYVLSIVAAIFLPLGFLTGLIGINVGGMPGVDYNLAFWIVCLICVGFMYGSVQALKVAIMLGVFFSPFATTTRLRTILNLVPDLPPFLTPRKRPITHDAYFCW
jgi:Mg2+ and Co2+ transporter CorA